MMNPSDTISLVTRSGVVGIVRTDSAARAVELSRQIWSAGVSAVEVALTTPGGLDAISELADDVPDGCVLGAGTVLDGTTARLAVLAGAQLLVTPTLTEDVIETAGRYGAATVIGTATPTEMLRAQTLGADLVKVFPASQWTPKTLADVLQALPQLRCVPTGGVSPDTAADWIRAGAAAVGIGSALTKGPDPAAQVRALLDAVGSARP
jgi:2-dehydro-3-deoxyphosphogluconate aldolase/(4S)-4-hydroxy-2-oxoglutarate aldolase